MIGQQPLKSKIYLGGPITGKRDGNKAEFNRVAKELRGMGYQVINPIELDKKGNKMTWAEYLSRDIPYLLKCHALVLLKGWGASMGASLEYRIARDLGKPIYFWEVIG